jgi:FKBP-type peptidyl-prolyl cis-trans isomerase/Domain amino terminal to FKBP-type peptidyl-prolyl isomerase
MPAMAGYGPSGGGFQPRLQADCGLTLTVLAVTIRSCLLPISALIAAKVVKNGIPKLYRSVPAVCARLRLKPPMLISWISSGAKSSVLLMLLALILAAPIALAADDALNPAANAAFLAANAAKPGTVVRPSGLQYRILRSGTGQRPGGDDLLRVSYSVRMIDGTVVDSTNPALPATISQSTIGMAGLAEALSLMHIGDRWQLVLPANLALGAKGAANGAVPPNQTLLFDVTLISAVAPAPGQTASDNPFSVWSNGRENGASFTIRP